MALSARRHGRLRRNRFALKPSDRVRMPGAPDQRPRDRRRSTASESRTTVAARPAAPMRGAPAFWVDADCGVRDVGARGSPEHRRHRRRRPGLAGPRLLGELAHRRDEPGPDAGPGRRPHTAPRCAGGIRRAISQRPQQREPLPAVAPDRALGGRPPTSSVGEPRAAPRGNARSRCDPFSRRVAVLPHDSPRARAHRLPILGRRQDVGGHLRARRFHARARDVDRRSAPDDRRGLRAQGLEHRDVRLDGRARLRLPRARAAAGLPRRRGGLAVPPLGRAGASPPADRSADGLRSTLRESWLDELRGRLPRSDHLARRDRRRGDRGARHTRPPRGHADPLLRGQRLGARLPAPRGSRQGQGHALRHRVPDAGW